MQSEAPAVDARRTLRIIHNPNAGLHRRRRLARAVAVLEAAGLSVEIADTKGPGDAVRLAEEAPASVSAVVAAGGDGTINEVVNGLMRRGGAPMPLGILPLGTANVLAYELGIPATPEQAAAVIADGRVRAIVPGVCEGRYYMMMCGAGFDGRVVRAVGPRLKRLLGKGAFVLATARQLWIGGMAPLAVAIDGAPPVPAASVVVSRGRFYGGRYVVAPAADLAEARLHVCLFDRGDRFATLAYLVWMGIGRLARRHDYVVVPAERVEIAGGSGAPVQADGEICGSVPIRVALAERALGVLVP